MKDRVSEPSTAIHSHPSPSLRTPQVTLRRQPIYDAHRQLYAYALSPQSDTSAPYGEENSSPNVQELLYYTFLETGLNQLVGSHQAVFRLTRGLLLMDYALVLPCERVILEIAEVTPPDDDLAETMAELKSQGYVFILNLPQCNLSLHHQLMTQAHIFNFDLTLWSHAKLQEYITHCRTYHAQFLVSGIDTAEDFQFCQTLGIDYYQGAFLGQADLITHRRSPVNRPGLLQLMTKLIDPATPFHEIEDLIRRDVSLCHNLLRLLSTSPSVPLEPIASIHQILQAIGVRPLITWVSLILLSGLYDKPHDLLTTAMIRAKMCESLAKSTQQDNPDTFFFTGFLSVLDALLDIAMPELAAALSLDESIRHALLHCEGQLGRILGAVLAYESGNWEALHQLGIDSTTITDSYLRAIVWAEESAGASS